MPTLSCPHQKAHKTKNVCSHLLEKKDSDYVRYFAGIGIQYHLVCHSCAKLFQNGDISLKAVCETCFKEIEETGYWDGLVGKPEVLYRSEQLAFVHHERQLSGLPSNSLIDIQPLQHLSDSTWIGLVDDGGLVRINFTNQVVSLITNVSPSVFDLKKPTSLQIAPDGSFVALTDTLGTEGLVLDLETGKTTMRLQRDGYHCDVTPFSAAFFVRNGKPLLIHSTAWNRLDISDPSTGELLTVREPTPYRHGEAQPEHYLDFFHGRLLISPDQEWIADDGWVWSPVGCVTSWNIRRWIEENPWESEDGISRRRLIWRDYFWGGPLCWIDKHVLAVWGYGQDDEWLIPAVCIFDVTSGDLQHWFAGTEVAPSEEKTQRNKSASYGGNLIFDKYLFACSEKYGISIWDVADGSCLHQDASFFPQWYHQGSKEFLSLVQDGSYRLTHLAEQAG